MSFLAIDIGNSRIKTGLFDENELVEIKIFEKTEDFYHYYCNARIEKSILSSVRNFNWNPLIRPFPLELGIATKLPITNLYKTKETLGNDRKAIVVGSTFAFPQSNRLIIDAGTCITYDFIDSKDNYHGGAISPGLAMRYKALNHFTSKLPELKYTSEEVKLIGDDTYSSIHSGVFNSMIFEIQGFIDQYVSRNQELKVLLTGGDSKYFEKHLKAAIFVQPNLQLQGLKQILEEND